MALAVVDHVAEKWGGAPHYRGSAFVLGRDDAGTWLWGPAGRTIMRGPVPAFVTDRDAITLVPPDAWWSASWWLDSPDVELYVNINTPVERLPGVLRYVDLDLDVVRLVDGTCEIVDREEFALHQVELGYPADIVAATAAAADEVLSAVACRVPPFDGAAARRWTVVARTSDLPGL